MNEESLEFLNGAYPYFKMLEKTNLTFQELVVENTRNSPYQNEQLLYTIVTELIRLYPVKIPTNENGDIDYSKVRLNNSDGILLLKDHIPFLQDDYKKIITNKNYIDALQVLLIIRNKYTHEPHNMRFACSVGGENSYSIGMYYKDELFTTSTTIIINIIFELNVIFKKIKKLYVETADSLDKKYKEYPCYKTISKMRITEHNNNYTRLPWDYLAFDKDVLWEGKTNEN